MHPRAQQLIDSHALVPHPEGGWYRQIFKSPECVTRHFDDAIRSAITTIYFLLVEGTASAPHVVKSDEIWHFYEGDPLELRVGDEVTTLDDDHRIGVVPANVWQSARPLGEYAFVGCTVGPGFEFEDFEMARNDRSSSGDSPRPPIP